MVGDFESRQISELDQRTKPGQAQGRLTQGRGPQAQSRPKQVNLGACGGHAEGRIESGSAGRLERPAVGQVKRVQGSETDDKESGHGDGHNTPMPPLGRDFFARDSVDVARDLIGARLALDGAGGSRLEGIIVETEAYSPNDQASHSYRGRTARNTAMFGPAGHVYVYFIYGVHFCLNVVTEAEDIGAAVLLRALRPVAGLEIMRRNRGENRALNEAALCRGPGNLCRALGIDRTWNGLDLCAPDARLRVNAQGGPEVVGVSRRIGVSGDMLAREAPRRFFAVGDPAVTRHSGGNAAET